MEIDVKHEPEEEDDDMPLVKVRLQWHSLQHRC
jgi:hypothetical protein